MLTPGSAAEAASHATPATGAARIRDAPSADGTGDVAAAVDGGGP